MKNKKDQEGIPVPLKLEDFIRGLNVSLDNMEIGDYVGENGRPGVYIEGAVEKEYKNDGVVSNSGQYSIQGKFDTITQVFELFPNYNLWIKTECISDSYASNVKLKSLQIVKGVEKTITVFEFE